MGCLFSSARSAVRSSGDDIQAFDDGVSSLQAVTELADAPASKIPNFARPVKPRPEPLSLYEVDSPSFETLALSAP